MGTKSSLPTMLVLDKLRVTQEGLEELKAKKEKSST